MENASKALIMAGGILLGVIVFSIFAYGFSNMDSFSNKYSETAENQAIDEFNSKFNIYLNREDLNIQDIITIYNLINEFNLKNNTQIEFKSTHKLKSDLEKDDKNIIFQYLDINSNINKKFKVELEYSNGKVSAVTISEKK